MKEKQHQNQNSLLIYRRRLGFSQKVVSRLLGHKDSTQLSRYEHGQCLPPLKAALQLGIILRVPVEFLFPGPYEAWRAAIRAKEEQLSSPCPL